VGKLAPHVTQGGAREISLTVDLRVPNAQKIPVVWPMPHITDTLNNFQGSVLFCSFDFVHGYWQMLLDEDSQECQSIGTPFGVYTPTRVLHGTTNANMHMQAVVEHTLMDIRPNIASCLDDVSPHGKSETEYLDALEKFFRSAEQAGLKLHAKKATLTSDSVHFCGRIVSAEGVKFAPKNFEALLNMQAPKTASELHQYLGAARWMRSHIPAYAERVAPLQSLLASVIADVGAKQRALRKWRSRQCGLPHIRNALTICRSSLRI
jgi:hypothetical protein